MRKNIIVGNWKMNMTQAESKKFMDELSKIELTNDVEYGVAPTFTSLSKVAELKSSNMILAAQDVYFEDSGAYTGAISIEMLKELGVTHILTGHSERRSIFLESDEIVNKKTVKILASGLTPILCVGESLDQREQEITERIVTEQLTRDFDGISAADAAKVVIAYEPIWAIGTGVTATSEQAQDACAFIRRHMASLYDETTAEAIRIQYGGSVKPENIKEILSKEDIDGALVGGASLEASSFSKLVNWK